MHRTRVHLTFVSVDQTRHVLEEQILVQLDNVNVVRMMSAHLRELVCLGNA